MSKDFFTDVSPSQERGVYYSLPNLLIESETQLIQFAYNTQTQQYESQSTVNLEEIHESQHSWELLSLPDSIIVGQNIEIRPNRQETNQSQSKVIKLSKSLEKVQVHECTDVAAIASDGKNIFLCDEGQLVALNKDLKILDKVDLELEGRGWRKKKNAHDILIYGSVAYLLDNVVEPTYILRVDLSNPSCLKILSTFEITGVNHHLRGQWLNPDLNQWCILQYYGTQAGSGENILILPLDLNSGSVDLSSSQIPFPSTELNRRAISLSKSTSISGYESISYSSFDGSENLGLMLIAITSSPPIWGLILDRKERLYLAKVQTENNQIDFQDKLYLGKVKKYSYLKAKITPIEKLLFLVIQEYKEPPSFTRLLIIDVAQEPSIILSQNLEVQSKYDLTMSYLLLPQN